ncbi:hypothetical protein ACRRTK_011121 [Alexandromys fortis]
MKKHQCLRGSSAGDGIRGRDSTSYRAAVAAPRTALNGGNCDNDHHRKTQRSSLRGAGQEQEGQPRVRCSESNTSPALAPPGPAQVPDSTPSPSLRPRPAARNRGRVGCPGEPELILGALPVQPAFSAAALAGPGGRPCSGLWPLRIPRPGDEERRRAQGQQRRGAPELASSWSRSPRGLRCAPRPAAASSQPASGPGRW